MIINRDNVLNYLMCFVQDASNGSHPKLAAPKLHSTTVFPHNKKKIYIYIYYLDDLIALNDGGCFELCKDSIYPKELQLSRTDKGGTRADYLDLDIHIEGGFFKSKLFDKRDHFPFKVINFPCLTYSNIPESPAYGTYMSQLLRICRLSSDTIDFDHSIDKLTNTFLDKGFNISKLSRTFYKFITRYPADWGKMGTEPSLPQNLHVI